jgi:anion-transporting  ArsA/GET3 family ATPase
MAKEGKKDLSYTKLQEILIENFVGLQKAMTNLSVKFEGLSEQIRRLLEIFESAAKNVASQSPEKNQELLDKLNSLLEQNKIIAKGLVLIEDRLNSQPASQAPQNQQSQQSTTPVQNFQNSKEGYSESVMSDARPKPLPRL